MNNKMIKNVKIYIRYDENDLSWFDYFSYKIFGEEITISQPKNIRIIFENDQEKIYDFDEITNIYNTNSNLFNYSINKNINYANIGMILKQPYCDYSQSVKKLNFSKLFSKTSFKFASLYNCIYTNILHQEIFGVIKINSSNINPIYEFAYDSELFMTNDIIFLIYKLMIM